MSEHDADRPDGDRPDQLDADRYLARIGLDCEAVATRDLETLARLQSAHVRSVPFETLSITGDPYGDYGGEPIELAIPELYEKIVDRERGGFCYELNGCFAWLLDAVGFDVRRCAARMAGEDGEYGIPAAHVALVVDRPLDGRHLVDVGTGAPMVRRPVPLDGRVVEDELGIEWRVVEPERPDADRRLEYRTPWHEGQGEPAGWTPRYIFTETSRDLGFFEASCEYLSTAPDSEFTGDPIAVRPTGDGHVTLTPNTLTRTVRGEREKRSIEPGEYGSLLAEEIGVRLDAN